MASFLQASTGGLKRRFRRHASPAVELSESGDWLGVYPPRSIDVLLIDLSDASGVALEPLEEGLAECTPFVDDAPMLFPLATALASFAVNWMYYHFPSPPLLSLPSLP